MNELDRLFIEDLGIYRHWDPQSEQYAGGDALLTMLLTGWQVRGSVIQDTYRCSGARQMSLFHFELEAEGESVSMAVICNPYVERIIRERHLRVVHLERSHRLETQTVEVAVPARLRREAAV